MKSMPAVNSTQQPDSRPDFNPSSGSHPDKTRFASLLRNENSRVQNGQQDRIEKVYENNVRPDGAAGDKSECNNCGAGSEDVLKNVTADENQGETEGIETIGNETESAEDQTADGKGLIIEELLGEMINKYTAEAGNGFAPVLSIEESTETGSIDSGGSQTKSNSENGLKEGALPDGIKLASESGLKNGALLNSLIAIDIPETGSDSYLSFITDQTADATGNETGNEEMSGNSENDLKIGNLLSRLFNSPSKTDINKEQTTGSVNAEEISTPAATSTDADLNDSGTTNLIIKKDSHSRTELSNEVFKHGVNKAHSGDAALDLDIQENHDNTEGLSNRPTTGFTDQFNYDNRLRNYSFNAPEVSRNIRSDAETGNIQLVNNSNVIHEGGRSVEGLFTGNSAKAQGFHELLDNIVYAVKANNKLGVTVEHDSFGKLNISLSLEKGLVNVHINTSDRVIREFIENNIQYIVDSLDKDGVDIGEFSIALKDHRNGEDDSSDTGSGPTEEILNDTKVEDGNNRIVSVFV